MFTFWIIAQDISFFSRPFYKIQIKYLLFFNSFFLMSSFPIKNRNFAILQTFLNYHYCLLFVQCTFVFSLFPYVTFSSSYGKLILVLSCYLRSLKNLLKIRTNILIKGYVYWSRKRCESYTVFRPLWCGPAVASRCGA